VVIRNRSCNLTSLTALIIAVMATDAPATLSGHFHLRIPAFEKLNRHFRRLLFLEWKYELPVALHVHHGPIIDGRCFQCGVEMTEIRLLVVGIFAIGIGMIQVAQSPRELMSDQQKSLNMTNAVTSRYFLRRGQIPKSS
jgi:hypothetical protein